MTAAMRLRLAGSYTKKEIGPPVGWMYWLVTAPVFRSAVKIPGSVEDPAPGAPRKKRRRPITSIAEGGNTAWVAPVDGTTVRTAADAGSIARRGATGEPVTV